MCRLLAYVADTDRSVADAVGASTFAAFRALSCVHGDGWGAAWVPPAGSQAVAKHMGERVGELEVRRSTVSAADDPAFATLGGQMRGRAGIVHLRWATEGLAVDAANTHPFVADGWAFAHNGFVPGADALTALLPPRHRQALRGTTDSERYFRLVLHCAERAGDLLEGVRAAARLILDLAGPVSINAVLLSADRLLAVQGLSGAVPPAEDLLAMVEHPDHLPDDHLDAYFHLAHRRVDGVTVVASSGLPREGWTLQESDSVLDVDVATGRAVLHGLLDASPRGAAVAVGAAAVDPG